jgi:hypothetical protein
VAERIVSDIGPGTVLDAGCGWGFLVEKLRERNVEAWGIDVSEYAIEKVHEDIRPYCRVASALDPLPHKYDLVITIEVLEHMPSAEAGRAAANLCAYTDDILFSSTPFDYKEATHFNVRPPEEWAELFARQGFLRDVDFDASFVTPWALRLRRQDETKVRMVREYERKFFLLWKENVDLRQQVADTENAVRSLRSQLSEEQRKNAPKDAKIRELSEEADEKNKEILYLREKADILDRILKSRSWKLMKIFQDLKQLLPSSKTPGR